MDAKQPITEQTKLKLNNIIQCNLIINSELLELLRKQITELDRIQSEIEDPTSSALTDLLNLRKTTEYTILLGLILQDLYCCYRNYIKAEEAYEVQHATKNLVIILYEGFQKIYHYTWKSDKDALITKYRNNTIWVKHIGSIVSNEIPSMKTGYDKLTILLEKFDDPILRSMKDPRNFFVHYDDTPSIAYDNIQNIHIESVSEKIIPFLNIINKMSDFVSTLNKNYSELLSTKVTRAYEESYQVLDNLKQSHHDNPTAVKIVEKGLQNLVNITLEFKRNN